MAEKSKNKNFVLRVDADTMEALEKWAADEFRSVNGQLQWIIADALRRDKRTPHPPKSANDSQME
ncbi:MAG: Arc family DNA binding domain-containing protein [Flavobacteriales bacterium]|nr:Arc family DNA binding domain-containing protein [Flavobacteriales bacterium]